MMKQGARTSFTLGLYDAYQFEAPRTLINVTNYVTHIIFNTVL